VIGQKAKLKKFKLWVDKDIVKQGVKFCIRPQGYGFANFHAQLGKKVPVTSLQRYLKDYKISKIKWVGRPGGEADAALHLKVSRKKEK
jgi:hypothetical protein